MLKDKKLFLLDIDGTVCKGEQLISGTREFLEDLKESGGQYVFITNNATKVFRTTLPLFRRWESRRTTQILSLPPMRRFSI